MRRQTDAADHRPGSFARDEARNGSCNMSIAPGFFGTPKLFTLPQAVRDALVAGRRPVRSVEWLRQSEPVTPDP